MNSDNVFEYSTKRITTVTISDGGSGYPTADDAPVFIDNADGTGAEIEVTTVNGSGTITAVELVNPGRNFGSSAPTITVGLDHDFSREYAINTVVADASHTNSSNEYIYKATVGGTTAASSANTRPGASA